MLAVYNRNMKPAKTDNLKSILNRIKNGELEHYQGQFFRGTACCLAGWDVALNSGTLIDPKKREQAYLHPPNEAYKYPWQWSKAANNLTKAEASMLFMCESTLELQLLVLEALEAGRRLNIVGFNYTKSLGYVKGRIKVLDYRDEIYTFLGLDKDQEFIA